MNDRSSSNKASERERESSSNKAEQAGQSHLRSQEQSGQKLDNKFTSTEHQYNRQ
jgi:hypothetical protein